MATKASTDVFDLEERLQECRTTYKLNVGYAGMPQLPAGFVDLVLRSNPGLKELDLSSNNLTDLPEEFSELRQMCVLRIKYNQLARLPAAVVRLPQLVTLELSGNQIVKLESSIAKMTSLRELDLSGNLLTELPQSLATLLKLEVLRLENNRLESLPDNMGELHSLIKLDVSTNCLRQLPASMGRLKRIQRIDAANNLLTRVPPSMGHLKSIKELNLKYNSLDDRYKAKTEEGLSKLLVFLREEEERERLEEVERLRPIGTAVGPYMEYRCKAEANQLLKTEFGEFNVDNRCWMRNGFSLTQVNNIVYVFGGQLVKDGSVSNELFWMTSERMEWHLQPTRGDRPVGRYGHVAVYDPDHHQLVVFGGRNADKRRLGDVAVLDLDSFTWRRPAVTGTAPSPREGAAAVYHAGHMVLFGGHASGGRTNDMLLLELSGWAWSQPTTTGTAPSPRSGAAMCVGHGRYLIIHGGRNNFVLDTAHVLDLMTKTWVDVSATGTAPPPRHGHHLHVHNDLLYLFGGLNDLGVSTVSLFKTTLPRQQVDRACALANAAAFGDSPGVGGGDGTTQDQSETAGDAAAGISSSAAVLQLEWQELGADLPYNKSRATVMQQGRMRCYQLGSATLGRSINDNDAERGLAHWDVYKTTQLDVFKPKHLVSAITNGNEPSGAQLSTSASSKASSVQHATHSAGKLPASFTSNSPKEQKLLACIADFQRVFKEFYPYRRPMPLTPMNECGVPKFICSTLRPSLPPCPELYNLESCAKFVSEFLTYEPLADPLHAPTHIPSPMSTLAWQTADPFDASVVLCSLLLGAGYNAFVVMGYAPLAVTLNDQSQVECPLLAQQQQGPWWATAGSPGAASTVAGSASTAATKTQTSSGIGSSTAAVSGTGAKTATGSSGGSKSNASAPGHAETSGSGQGSGGGGTTSAGSAGSTVGAAASHGSSVAATADEPGKRKKYHIRPKPELLSKFLQQHQQEQEQGDSDDNMPPSAEEIVTDSMLKLSVTDQPGGSATQQPCPAEEVQDAQQQHLDKLANKRVHAWVLVLPAKREVLRPVFAEPSTGRLLNPAGPDCPYTGVELIWNASNAWVCMQAPQPHSDARATPGSISWELNNAALWEAVLDEHQTRRGAADLSQDTRGGSSTLAGTASRAGLATSVINVNSSMAVGSTVGGRPHTPNFGANLPRSGIAPGNGGIATQLSRVASRALLGTAPVAGSLSGTAGATAVGPAPGTPGRPDSSSRVATGPSAAEAVGAGTAGSIVGGHGGRGPPSEYARSEYARSEIGDGSAVGSAAAGADELGLATDLLPDLPPSWVPKLAVARDMMDMRCPRGSRTTLYRRCTHEIFAPFGECARWDGLVERVTRFADDARHVVEEVCETFARRKDKLQQRRTFPTQHTVHEWFGHGSLFSVKELRIVRGERREINFYAAARLDGLMRREEVFGCKITEHFSGRDDFLIYRSSTFGAASASLGSAGMAGELSTGTTALGAAFAADVAGGNMLGSQPSQSAAGYGLPGNQQQQQMARALPGIKITQKFARNTATPADQDVAKQVFYLAAGKTLVHFHHADERLTAGYVEFQRDGPAQAVQVDPLAPHPSGRELLEMYRTLQAKEKEVLQAVRDSEWEGREIARTRNSQEQAISLETPYYDICRIQAEDSDDEPPDSEASMHDYLLPFLPPGMALAGGAGSLTREQALAVRERCLRALKDRLIERANIIQARLDAEQAALARRQATYARDHDTLTPEEEEEYEKAVEDAAFRANILQKRLARHEETALQQYYQLDKRLRADPRLSILLKPV